MDNEKLHIDPNVRKFLQIADGKELDRISNEGIQTIMQGFDITCLQCLSKDVSSETEQGYCCDISLKLKCNNCEQVWYV